MRCRSAIFLALVLVWPAVAVGSQSTQQNVGDEPLKLSAQLVVLDAQVLNKKTGAIVGGLAREHFTLYEDGIKQQITHFSQDKLPLSIIGDIKSIGPWIQEGTYINEAVYEASKHLAKASNPDSRRIIIVVTDNIKSEPVPLGHSASEAIESLLESGVALCGLVVGDFASLARDYLAKGWLISDSIGNYVDETGGIALQVDNHNAATKLAALIERLRTRYSFGYTSKDEKRDGRFHKISLKVSSEVERREGGISIIARKGYYAPGR